MEGEFKQCPNGHYYQGNECPYCRTLYVSTEKVVITIGRGTENDVIINNPDVHYVHCVIERIGEYKYHIIDLKTKIGTFVNGKKLSYSMDIGPNDEVKVGDSVVLWAHHFVRLYNSRLYNRDEGHLSGIIISPTLWDATQKRKSDGKLFLFANGIVEGRNVIGRDMDCDIIVDDSMVSPKHAVLIYEANKFSIEDTQSSQGTFVNGEKIDSEPMPLKNGDEIKIGNTRFRFKKQTNCLDTKNIKLVGWLVRNEATTENFNLHESRSIIGRDMDCNITINDNMVSAKHAVLIYGANKYSITDSQSSHGTFVNGEDIGEESRYLQDGDKIRIGKTEFLFKIQEKIN